MHGRQGRPALGLSPALQTHISTLWISSTLPSTFPFRYLVTAPRVTAPLELDPQSQGTKHAEDARLSDSDGNVAVLSGHGGSIFRSVSRIHSGTMDVGSMTDKRSGMEVWWEMEFA